MRCWAFVQRLRKTQLIINCGNKQESTSFIAYHRDGIESHRQIEIIKLLKKQSLSLIIKFTDNLQKHEIFVVYIIFPAITVKELRWTGALELAEQG